MFAFKEKIFAFAATQHVEIHGIHDLVTSESPTVNDHGAMVVKGFHYGTMSLGQYGNLNQKLNINWYWVTAGSIPPELDAIRFDIFWR